MNQLEELAAYLAELSRENVPDWVKEKTAVCVLDTVACAVGAIQNVQLESVTELYGWIFGKKGEASVWARNEKTNAPTAAFLNAMAGHTLEMDDVNTASKTHIGTVVVPAAWALAQALGKSGGELLLAILCGYEAMARIGAGFGVASHRYRGWHVTATAGTFGAAAACAKLLNLDGGQMLSAFGMAGTQSFGVWAFLEDGSSCKVLHPARAASSGMEAALLARAGMTGPQHILSAKDGGLYPATSDAYDYDKVSDRLGSHWEIACMDFKPYPCCRSAHCAIDGALALREKLPLGEDAIDAIKVSTYLAGYKQCGVSQGSRMPEKSHEAKFSIPYTVAAALHTGEVSLRTFTQQAIEDVCVRELTKKVTVVPDEAFTALYPAHWGCRVDITLTDGRTFTTTIPDASGSVENPLEEGQVRAKALSLLEVGYPGHAERIADAILAMDGMENLPQL